MSRVTIGTYAISIAATGKMTPSEIAKLEEAIDEQMEAATETLRANLWEQFPEAALGFTRQVL